MVDFPRRPKITDPMEVWESYWQASAEAIVWLVRTPEMIGLDHEAIAKKLKASAMVVGMALALNPYSTDVLSARSKRRKLLGVLIEHYLPVARNLAIEKARQTGEDFGCYLAIGEQTIRETIPRWQTGRAPFANYVNPRCKWAFHDEVHRGRWSQSTELTEEFVAPETEEEPVDKGIWKAVSTLPLHQVEIVNRVFRYGQSAAEVAASMQRSQGYVNEQRDAAVASLKELFGENWG
jgi:hypothetical protein